MNNFVSALIRTMFISGGDGEIPVRVASLPDATHLIQMFRIVILSVHLVDDPIVRIGYAAAGRRDNIQDTGPRGPAPIEGFRTKIILYCEGPAMLRSTVFLR